MNRNFREVFEIIDKEMLAVFKCSRFVVALPVIGMGNTFRNSLISDNLQDLGQVICNRLGANHVVVFVSVEDRLFECVPSLFRGGFASSYPGKAKKVFTKFNYLLADKGYDSDTFLGFLEARQVNPVIPSRKRHKAPRDYDKYLYGLRHLVENAFLALEHRRGVATRYAKNTASFQIEICHKWAIWIATMWGRLNLWCVYVLGSINFVFHA